jgi:hypothetical protein
VQLGLDRAYAAATGSGDLGIRHAFAAEDGDLALAWRQRRERREDRFAGNRKVWIAASLALEGDQKTSIGQGRTFRAVMRTLADMGARMCAIVRSVADRRRLWLARLFLHSAFISEHAASTSSGSSARSLLTTGTMPPLRQAAQISSPERFRNFAFRSQPSRRTGSGRSRTRSSSAKNLT